MMRGVRLIANVVVLWIPLGQTLHCLGEAIHAPPTAVLAKIRSMPKPIAIHPASHCFTPDPLIPSGVALPRPVSQILSHPQMILPREQGPKDKLFTLAHGPPHERGQPVLSASSFQKTLPLLI